MSDMFNLRAYIDTVPDFPKPGIMFRDDARLLESPRIRTYAFNLMRSHLDEAGVEKIAAIDSRGFIYGTGAGNGLPIVKVRKAGKLPVPPCDPVIHRSEDGRLVVTERLVTVYYGLEYGKDALQIHRGRIQKGEKVGVVDDVAATGGTAEAAARAIEYEGGVIACYTFLIELPEARADDRMNARERLMEHHGGKDLVKSLLKF